MAETEEDRIVVMNQLHVASKKSPHYIGKLLTEQEKAIKHEYNDFLRNKGIYGDDDMPPGSLYDWFMQNKERDDGLKILFSYNQAREYIRLFETTDEEIGNQLGTSKNKVIESAKTIPSDVRNKLREQAIDNNWNREKLKQEVDRIKETLEKKEHFENEIKPILPSINFKVNKGKVTIDLTDNDEYDTEELANLLFTYLVNKQESLKRYLHDRLG